MLLIYTSYELNRQFLKHSSKAIFLCAGSSNSAQGVQSYSWRSSVSHLFRTKLEHEDMKMLGRCSTGGHKYHLEELCVVLVQPGSAGGAVWF